MGITDIVLIIDASGSMNDVRQDTIVGLKKFLSKQKDLNQGDATITYVNFNSVVNTVLSRKLLSEVNDSIFNDYTTGGLTALFDAIGKTIKLIKSVHSKMNPVELPEKVMVVILTDGFENSSETYAFDNIRDMIDECKLDKEVEWEFLFMGADIDAFAASDRLNLSSIINVTKSNMVGNMINAATYTSNYRNYDKLKNSGIAYDHQADRLSVFDDKRKD